MKIVQEGVIEEFRLCAHIVSPRWRARTNVIIVIFTPWDCLILQLISSWEGSLFIKVNQRNVYHFHRREKLLTLLQKANSWTYNFVEVSGHNLVHPQNVRFQNVRFQNVRFPNVWNVRFTKRQVYKMSGLQNVRSSKRPVAKKSIYILYLWLVEIRRFCCSHVSRQSDGCVLFSIL